MTNVEDSARESVEMPLSAAEHALLATVVAALEGCDAGLDDGALFTIKVALHAVVPFDRIAIHVEDRSSEDGAASHFCVLWRDGARSPLPAVFSAGRLIPGDEELGLRMKTRPPGGPGAPRIAETLDPGGSPIERALRSGGVQSFTTVPMRARGVAVGFLSLAHDDPGAPSQRWLPLLMAVAKLLGPALVRARRLARGRLFEALAEASPDGMLALDGTLTVTEANAAALRMLGRTRATALGAPLAALIGEEASIALRRALDGELRTTTPLDVTVSDGHGTTPAHLAIEALAAPVLGVTEARFQVHLRDARARRTAEEATARRVEHLAFLRGLAESMAGDLRVQTALERAAGFCMKRGETSGVVVFRSMNDGSLHLVAARGAGKELAARLSDLTPRALEERLAEEASEVRRFGGVMEVVFGAVPPGSAGATPAPRLLVSLAHGRRPLGAILVIGRPGVPLVDSERELWESVGTTVSAALHAADDFEHVVALEAEKRQLVDNLPVIVARLDPKTGATLFANGAIERVLGFSTSEVIGHPGMDALFADPIEWEASAIARDRAARGREATWQDRRYRHKDGRVLTLRENVYPVLDATGAVRAIEVLAYDVTTEIESRKQLMQSDRLASLGALAAGIAHEINNPVAFISLAAAQLTKSLDQLNGFRDEATAERARELVREVSESAARIANIVGELKLFTRIPEGALSTPVDLNRIVQMAVTLTSAELRRRARVEVALGELPLVPGEYTVLGQAFVNLLINAAQAVDAKLTGPRDGAPNVVRVSTFTQEGAIIVRVTDTGVGIESRMIPRIFDPFFKTKAAGEGAGLGLAIAHNLVRRVGGDIRVTSEPGEGTTFDVLLPVDVPPEMVSRITPSGSMRSAAAVAPAPSASRGRVLIVDDEQALAKALARQLSQNYDVDTVSTASDALAELSVRSYDVVVCDLRMPDQSGPAIYEATLGRSPRQASRFIFTTGGSYGTGDDEIHERAQSTGRPILEKPFDGASFEAAVAEVAHEARHGLS